MHHFLPGMGLALAAGGVAILTSPKGRGLSLSLPFGAGAGLTLDEIALLTKRDNPYWDSEKFALSLSLAAALLATGLVARFHRRGKP